jgi:hypothetical protein
MSTTITENDIYSQLNKGFVEYYDDLVPKYLQDYYINLIKNKMEPVTGLEFFYSEDLSIEDNQMGEFGFGCNIQDKDASFYHKSHYVISTPIHLLCKKLDLALFDIYQVRSWIQTPQNHSNTFLPHQDLNHPHYVLLYYVSDSDGDTVFYDDDGVTEIKRVSPKKGRVVFFDGSILHAASNPTTVPRIVFNYNFLAFSNQSLKNIFPKYK